MAKETKGKKQEHSDIWKYVLIAIVGIALVYGVAVLSSSSTTSPLSFSASTVPLSGAIFTTTPNGSIVNENVRYGDKREVYLDGGPPANAPARSAGLPAGLYVFQITDPSGAVLLSQDPAKCRIVNVSSDGVIVNYVLPSTLGLGLTDSYPTPIYPKPKPGSTPSLQCQNQDGPEGAMGVNGTHDTNHDVDHFSDKGAIVVQMMPFLDTPNPGGVYKAWITPIGDYVIKGGNLTVVPNDRGQAKKGGKVLGYNPDPGFGPSRNAVKTDNFKVKGPAFVPPMLNVFKFLDTNANGVRDSGEPLIPWNVSITDPLSVTNNYITPVSIVADPAGNYTILEELPSGWLESVVYVDGVSKGAVNPIIVTVVGTSKENHTVLFGDFMTANVSGTKFIDLNGNGLADDGFVCPAAPDVNNPGCEGVTVKLDGVMGNGSILNLTTTTDANGDYQFTGVVPGTYTITVVEPNGNDFVCSYPSTCSYSLNLVSGQVSTGNNFGDFSLAEISGYKFDDLNANKQWDPLEPGLEGVTITLNGTNGTGGAVDMSTVSDAFGKFSFENLAPGTYTVHEILPEGRNASTPISSGPHTLVSDNVTDLGKVFGNFLPAEVHGDKYIDMDGDGVRDEGEGCPPDPPNNAGCAGVTVKLDGVSGLGSIVNLTATTDSSGSFSFTNIVPGVYTLTVIDPAGFTCSAPEGCSYNLELTSGEIAVGKDFADFLPVSVIAHKFFDFDRDGSKDTFEVDLSGVEFCLYRDVSGNWVLVEENATGGTLDGCQDTNSEGLAQWMYIAPGSFNLTEALVSGLFNTTAREKIFTLVSGNGTVTFDFGNTAECNGLTPGFWKNWRNHYNESVMNELLQGTIASNIADVDAIFTNFDNSLCNELHHLKAMILANQLTLSLSQTDYFNSNKNLVGACLITGNEQTGTLDNALSKALALLNDPSCDDGDCSTQPATPSSCKDTYNGDGGSTYWAGILDQFANQGGG